MMNEEDMMKGLAGKMKDQWWRLNHLYWIKNKDAKVVRFRPNEAQEKLYRSLHNRNIILKGRQFGISTFSVIYFLDICLFTPHIKCGIIDRDEDEAKKKLAKAALAWKYLDFVPEGATPQEVAIAGLGSALKRKRSNNGALRVVSKTEIKLGNGAEFTFDSCFRGDTLNYLHVSELAKISLERPIDAAEIVTGGFEAVPQEGQIIVESTHKGGKMGINYDLCELGMKNAGKKLYPLEWKFHFFSWVDHSEYRTEGEEALVAPDDLAEYFLRDREGGHCSG